MRWENSQFIIDKSLRLILLNTLRLQNPNTCWRLLEDAAYKMYAAWADKYPKSRAYYQAKANNHAQAVQRPAGDASPAVNDRFGGLMD
jgi:hypothetical protein